MSNTITLPDNISFEEIATKWCRRIYRTIRFSRAFYELVSYENDFRHDIIAIILPDKRTFIYPPDSQEKLQPILNFIKERSHA